MLTKINQSSKECPEYPLPGHTASTNVVTNINNERSPPPFSSLQKPTNSPLNYPQPSRRYLLASTLLGAPHSTCAPNEVAAMQCRVSIAARYGADFGGGLGVQDGRQRDDGEEKVGGYNELHCARSKGWT
jgi:hypothetical protein